MMYLAAEKAPFAGSGHLPRIPARLASRVLTSLYCVPKSYGVELFIARPRPEAFRQALDNKLSIARVGGGTAQSL